VISYLLLVLVMLAVYMVYICIEIMSRYSFKSSLAAINFHTNWLVSVLKHQVLTASNSRLVKVFQWLMLPTQTVIELAPLTSSFYGIRNLVSLIFGT
jgi:hypothetical protein